MRTTALRALPVSVAAVMALVATSCSGSDETDDAAAPITGISSTAAPGTGSAAPAATSAGPDAPSPEATMVCEAEVQQDLAAALKVQPSKPPTATWRDHLYTCVYTYPTGTMVLSVKELADDPAAIAYYAEMKKSFTATTTRRIEGQEAFTAPNGSVFVQKDAKVLHVDVTRLPARFGQPPFPRAIAAMNVAITVMGCWTGD